MTRVQTAVACVLPLLLVPLTLSSLGCGGGSTSAQVQKEPGEGGAKDEVATERVKLSPEDRALVEAQEWCVVSSDERLGSMGAPMKLDISGQAVFICCKGCERKAKADPEKTLKKLEELKAKARAEKGK